MINFLFLGIPIRIEPWFWITMVFLGGATSATTPQAWMFVGLFVFAGFISILTHELGHALLIRKYGLPTTITLAAFGGFASYPAGVLSRRQSFMVTAGGPAIQIALGLISIAALMWAPIPEKSLLLVFLLNLSWISIVWALFNCLPIYPLDGGQMLSSIFGNHRRRHVHYVGLSTAVIMAGAALYFTTSWILPAFMVYFAWMNWEGSKLEEKKH